LFVCCSNFWDSSHELLVNASLGQWYVIPVKMEASMLEFGSSRALDVTFISIYYVDSLPVLTFSFLPLTKYPLLKIRLLGTSDLSDEIS
jgi:hypothetical protein